MDVGRGFLLVDSEELSVSDEDEAGVGCGFEEEGLAFGATLAELDEPILGASFRAGFTFGASSSSELLSLESEEVTILAFDLSFAGFLLLLTGRSTLAEFPLVTDLGLEMGTFSSARFFLAVFFACKSVLCAI